MSIRRPKLRSVFGLALAVVTIGAACDAPVSFQTPRPSQLIDDSSVVVNARMARAFDETSAELLVDGVDLLAELAVVPPFTNVSGVVQIGGAAVLVSELTWAEPPGSFDTITFRLTGLEPDTHLLELRGLDTGAMLKTATRSFASTEELALTLETWDAAGLSPATQGLPFGKAASASLGAGFAGGVIPLSGGGSLREGLPAAAAALKGTP